MCRTDLRHDHVVIICVGGKTVDRWIKAKRQTTSTPENLRDAQYSQQDQARASRQICVKLRPIIAAGRPPDPHKHQKVIWQ